MATALSRITALRIACPLPEKTEEATLAKIATMDAPSNPRPMPPATHRPRPAIPRLAPSTMAMMSAASSTSRNMMTAVASILVLLVDGRLRHNRALHLVVKIIKELVVPRIQWPNIDRHFAMPPHDDLTGKVRAFKFGR